MKHVKQLSKIAIIIIGFGANTVRAQEAVIDVAAIAQAAEQVAAWGEQHGQMIQQIQSMASQLQQLQQTYQSLNGSRGMQNLVNNPALRNYLPSDYQQILNNGYGNSNQIRAASKLFGIEDTTLSPDSGSARLFESTASQAAINRATAEDAYQQASNRFAKIQVLLDKVGDAPDQKDVADLQARIQAEQVMMQNEQVKLAMLTNLQQAQRDLEIQQGTELRMKSTKSHDIPRF